MCSVCRGPLSSDRSGANPSDTCDSGYRSRSGGVGTRSMPETRSISSALGYGFGETRQTCKRGSPPVRIREGNVRSAMNVNRVVLTGNLTADPEFREVQGGNSLCRLRLACNTRRRQPDGSWGNKPNYFDVVVWGPQGQSASRFLAKGSPVAIDGRLEWREWITEAGEKRQAVEIIAENLQFLDSHPADPARRPPDPEKTSHTPNDDIPF